MHPYSHGPIHIDSADPKAYPVTHPGHLSSPPAVNLEYCRSVPADSRNDKAVLVDLEEWLIHRIRLRARQSCCCLRDVEETMKTIPHATGRCAVEPESASSVVNPQLLVYGTRGLRIINASIAPMLQRRTVECFLCYCGERCRFYEARCLGVEAELKCPLSYEAYHPGLLRSFLLPFDNLDRPFPHSIHIQTLARINRFYRS